jgi:hypothetical protein
MRIHGLTILTDSYLRDCKGVILTLIFHSALDLATASVNYLDSGNSPSPHLNFELALAAL